MGIGTCWVCNFDANILKDALNLDNVLEPVAIIPIGYPSDNTSIETEQPKNRKSIEEFTEWM